MKACKEALANLKLCDASSKQNIAMFLTLYCCNATHYDITHSLMLHLASLPISIIGYALGFCDIKCFVILTRITWTLEEVKDSSWCYRDAAGVFLLFLMETCQWRKSLTSLTEKSKTMFLCLNLLMSLKQIYNFFDIYNSFTICF